MISLRWGRNLIAALIVNALIDPTYLFAQSQPSPAPTDQHVSQGGSTAGPSH
jgi:hypothetical protein